MVLKGQFLERSTLIPLPSDGVVLEGTAHRGERQPPLLILPPRPEEGGGMDHVVAAELAFAAARAGHATLRFNYRGVGASQGGRGGPLEEDAAAALDVALENARARSAAVAALHGSASVALALQARRPQAAGLCLVGPRELPLADLRRLSVPLLVILWAGDVRTPRAPLAEAVAEAGGTLELVQDEGPAFPRNLAAVGRLVAHWLHGVAGAAGPSP
jgi:alpha/beta superfamily hydrolase